MVEKKYDNGQLQNTKTKYYSTNYEKESIDNGISITNRQLHYIFAPDGLAAIYEMKDNTNNMYYVSTDNLGSINLLVKEDGSIASDQCYDACSMRAWFSQTFSAAKTIAELIPSDCKELREGRQRNPVNWTFDNLTSNTITDRGFTGHEHMPSFGLINMNGRVYDPSIGQFLSPDPFVSFPENSQSYNRYAYCLNNPLKFTDPSGYWPTYSLQWFMTQYMDYSLAKNACLFNDMSTLSNNLFSPETKVIRMDAIPFKQKLEDENWNLGFTCNIPSKTPASIELNQSTSFPNGYRDVRDAFFGAASYEDYLRNNYIKTERGMSSIKNEPASVNDLTREKYFAGIGFGGELNFLNFSVSLTYFNLGNSNGLAITFGSGPSTNISLNVIGSVITSKRNNFNLNELQGNGAEINLGFPSFSISSSSNNFSEPSYYTNTLGLGVGTPFKYSGSLITTKTFVIPMPSVFLGFPF